MNKYIFSIVILVYNEEKTIKLLLTKLIKSIEYLNYRTEIIIINSQSTDKTLTLINEVKNLYPKVVKTFSIKKEDFSYGNTRNLAVNKSRGKYILFISGDCTLKDNHILKKMLEDFSMDNRIVSVFGKQIPRSLHTPLTLAEYHCRYKSLDKYAGKDGKLIQKAGDVDKYRKLNELFYLYFLSNAFACYKRSFLIKNPFNNLKRSEDIVLGKKIIDSGLYKVYDNRCQIVHSHNNKIKRKIVDIFNEYKISFGHLNIPRKSTFLCQLSYIKNTDKHFLRKLTDIFILIFLSFVKVIFFNYFIVLKNFSKDNLEILS